MFHAFNATGNKVKQLNVMFVDDDAAIRDAAVVLLRRRVETVQSARSVSEALDLLGSSSVDVVITDYRMPGGTGAELARAIRQNEHAGSKRTTIVVTTAYRANDVPELEDTTLFDAVIGKPFAPPELFALLESVAGKREI